MKAAAMLRSGEGLSIAVGNTTSEYAAAGESCSSVTKMTGH
jgi:hypothetical protein